MLTLSKIDSPQMEKLDSKVDIVQVLDNAIFVLQPALIAKKIELAIKIDDITFERSRRRRTDSARFYSTSLLTQLNSALKVHQLKLHYLLSRNNRPYVSISVTDHGIGIPEEDQSNSLPGFSEEKMQFQHSFQGLALASLLPNILVKIMEAQSRFFYRRQGQHLHNYPARLPR
jgi:signal transduction histidine kinase